MEKNLAIARPNWRACAKGNNDKELGLIGCTCCNLKIRTVLHTFYW